MDFNSEVKRLSNLIFLLSGSRKEVVVVCIGTDCVLGDCLGPLVGEMLVKSGLKAFVYGTLKSPITALNADSYTRFIASNHPNALVIAIDSCVGKSSEVGKIKICKGKIYPASALNKQLLGIGDICITGIVSDFLPQTKQFCAVRLQLVHRLAVFAAAVVLRCVYMYNYRAKWHNLQSHTPILSIRV